MCNYFNKYESQKDMDKFIDLVGFPGKVFVLPDSVISR